MKKTGKKLNPERHLYFNLSSFPSNRCRNKGVQTIPFLYTQVMHLFILNWKSVSRGIRGFVNKSWFGYDYALDNLELTWF